MLRAGDARTRLARLYLLLLGAGLLVEGTAELVLWRLPANAAPALLAAFPPDPPHELIHVTWGLALLLVMLRGGRAAQACAGLAFAAFYLALAALGLAFHNPFGLQLGAGQNAFHLLVGPLALAAGIQLTRALRNA